MLHRESKLHAVTWTPPSLTPKLLAIGLTDVELTLKVGMARPGGWDKWLLSECYVYDTL